MKSGRYRAWQFLHPDFYGAEDAPGLRIAPTGGVAMVEEEASVRQAILLLLSTSPGERVMRPEYGCELRKLDAGRSEEDPTRLTVSLEYRVRATQSLQDASFSVNLAGE